MRGNEIGRATKAVAEAVLNRREELGWGLQDVANLLVAHGWPISVSSLSKLERGLRRIDIDDLVAIASVLELEPENLVGGIAEVTASDVLHDLVARQESLTTAFNALVERMDRVNGNG